VDPLIPFGGPGTPGGLKSKYLKLLLAHCDTGINYFTGERGTRIDFISIHVKDGPREMVEQEIEVINWIKQHHPRLSDLPFMNDEADPISGWRTEYWWRSTPWHAAFIAQSVDLHYSGIIEGEKMKYAILSNDNAFLGNWLHRTQFARFSKDREEGFSFVKKPAFTVFTMLSLLGNEVLQSHSPINLPDDVGVLPTMHRDGKIAMLLYNKAPIDIRGKKRGEKENILLDCGDEDINLQVKNLPGNEYALIMYRIDESHGNPFKVWQEMGAPDLPSKSQLDILRENQEIYIERMTGTIKTSENGIDETINLPASSVCLILLVPKDSMVNQPTIRGLWINEYENLHGGTDYMIRWESPGHNNVLTYEVWYSGDNENFRKVNPTSVIDKGYLFSPAREIKEGFIKVRAVDFWGNKGPFSRTIILN
jgi:L-iduronidase